MSIPRSESAACPSGVGPDAARDPDQREMGTVDVLGTCESILAEHDALDRCVSIEPRRHEGQHADLRLLFADRKWLQSSAGEELVAALEEHPVATSVQRHKSAILLRFNDAALAGLERRLAAGESVGLETDLLDGRLITVGFVGPNTNKALHVGHLRNIVLGQALASALASAGATVQRHSLVGDIGRRVCEAMGGYLTHHDGETPQTRALTGDRFVELCFRDYPHDPTQSATIGGVSDPNAEEQETRNDLADTIMKAWLLGAARERALWRRMRDWAFTGHLQTLARLGVRMDRYDFESEEIQRALDLVARGLERGLFKREAAGGVIYQTGRSEYTTMVLLRQDGAPTEYARLLGVYHRMLEDLDPDAVYVEVVGIEWQPATAVLGELLAALLRSPHDTRYLWVFHGSVTVGGRKMASSNGEVMWIDDLLDEIAAGPGIAALQELAHGAAGREELADMVVRGTFLCSPTAQPLEFGLDHLLEGPPGPGWTIAEAWCRAQGPQIPARTAPVARTAVVQSQLYRRSLLRAVQKRDAAKLATYLLGLSEACLAAPEPGAAAAPILRGTLRSLGFVVGNQRPRQRDGGWSHHASHRDPIAA
jgi:arginyl-tRNA synthetase